MRRRDGGWFGGAYWLALATALATIGATGLLASDDSHRSDALTLLLQVTLGAGVAIFTLLAWRPGVDWVGDRWDWRGWGWRTGHYRQPEFPPDATYLWLQARDGQLRQELVLRCRVRDPDANPTRADAVLENGSKSTPEQGHYSAFFPKSFAGAPQPLATRLRVPLPSL